MKLEPISEFLSEPYDFLLIPSVEEIFFYGEEQLRCIDRMDKQCKGCFFWEKFNCDQFLCIGEDRPDKIDVMFVNDTKRENARNEQSKVVATEKEFYFY